MIRITQEPVSIDHGRICTKPTGTLAAHRDGTMAYQILKAHNTSGDMEHLTLKGLKYPLTDACLRGFCSLGVSNEIVADTAEISFESGILLVVESKD